MSNLLLSYYGDDFTGSTDVMEALAANGVPTALFLGVPSAATLERFKDCRAIGIAGTSRSETPQWMDEHLTPVFKWLGSLEAAICHYKVCSTFDSSPKVGSIGKAIEIGKAVFRQSVVPVVVGAPQLKRYTAFGQLFAAYQGQVFRTQDVAGSEQNFVFGGFRNKNREFIESLKSGADLCSSPFRDTIKTMRVCHTILAQALAEDTAKLQPAG
mgnify:CR=1 FL=1